MLEKISVSFFRIAECGYFKWGSPAPEFGGVDLLLQELRAWSKGKPLVNTKLFEPDEKADIMPAYMMDLQDKDGSWLMTTWNEVNQTRDGGVASVRADSTVGSAEVFVNEIEEGTIPGFATYFWFVPNERIFATLRFNHPISGQRPMQMYCEAFLESASSHVVWDKPEFVEGSELTVLGYAEHSGEAPQRLHPRFRTELFDKPAARQALLQNSDKIRKIHRRTNMKLASKDQRDIWQKGLSLIGMGQPPAPPKKVRVQASITSTITKKELNEIISKWDADGRKEWDDFGFQMKGDSKPIWLSGTYARGEVSVDVDWKNQELVDTEKLLAAIVTKKAQFMSLLK